MVWRPGSCADGKFYYERQNGGLCRMHALNAYFGGPKLDRALFDSNIREYDICQKRDGRDVPSAAEFDSIGGNQQNIISHVLAKYGVFSRFYNIRERVRAVAKAKQYGVAFVHSPDHVWLIKQDAITRFWYKIDSLSGVSPYNIDELSHDLSLGMIIPATDLLYEFNEIAGELNTLVTPDIVDYLIGEMKSKRVLGDAELLMGAAISLLEIQNNGRVVPVLSELFSWYKQFTHDFTGGNCCSIHYVLSAVPQMIARILSIWRRTRVIFGTNIPPKLIP